MHVIAGKAVALRQAMQPEFAAYARRIVDNAQTLAQGLQARGLRIVSGGTDNHMMLVDLSGIGLTGRMGEAVLETAGITVNKNMIPHDPESPMVTSGIRIGTPAATTRGFGPGEMSQVAELIVQVLRAPEDERVAVAVRAKVRELCERFPVPILGQRK